MSCLVAFVLSQALLGLGLLVSLYLFVCAKREATALKKAWKNEQQAALAAFQDTWKRMEELRTAVDDRFQDIPVPGPPKPGMNLNKRAQALRMHRRGQNTQQIAAVLSIPQNEVDLLLKLNMAVSQPAVPVPAAT